MNNEDSRQRNRLAENRVFQYKNVVAVDQVYWAQISSLQNQFILAKKDVKEL
jgi:hypothetical protein